MAVSVRYMMFSAIIMSGFYKGFSQSLSPSSQLVCPQCPVEFTCVLTVAAGLTRYDFSGVNVSECASNTVGIFQDPPCAGNDVLMPCGNFTVANANETTAEGHCLTSTLTVTATLDLNGTSIVCLSTSVNGDEQSTGTATLIVTGPPSTPTLYSPVCTPINSTSVGVAVSWSGPLYMYDVVDGYTLTAQGPVGDCTPESPCQLTSLERDFVLEFGESYTFTVSATNCQSSSCGEAQSSEDETTVSLSDPATDLKLEVCPVYGSDYELKQAVASWTTLCPVLISPGDIPCVSVDQYQLQLSPGSDPGLTVDCTGCGACGCQCSGCVAVTDQLQEADIITVTLTALVGGVPYQTASTTIGSANNILQVDFMPYMLLDTVEVTCTFLDGFTGSDTAGCRISYGTDQQNLSNTASSGQREEGRDSVQLNLTLSHNQLYYYEVTVDEGTGDCVGVKVEGTYVLSGCNPTDLCPSASSVCTVMGTSIAIDGGSVEFTGLTPGSEAVYTCDDGYGIVGGTNRTCLMTAMWSGETPRCVESSTTESPTTESPTTTSPTTSNDLPIAAIAGGAVGGIICLLLVVAIVVIVLVFFAPCRKQGKEDKEGVDVEMNATYADPNVIEHKEGPETGDLYAQPIRTKKKPKAAPATAGPVYQDPNTIEHEAGPETGEMYAQLDRSKKKKQPKAAPATAGSIYQDPNTIEHEAGPETGEMYAQLDRSKKKKKPKAAPATATTGAVYQDPNAIEHEAAPGTGDTYAIPDKPKRGGSRKTQEELDTMYSLPDKSKKKINPELLYADVEVGPPRRHPAPPPKDNEQVLYSTVMY